jgi:hypothetical protein
MEDCLSDTVSGHFGPKSGKFADQDILQAFTVDILGGLASASGTQEKRKQEKENEGKNVSVSSPSLLPPVPCLATAAPPARDPTSAPLPSSSFLRLCAAPRLVRIWDRVLVRPPNLSVRLIGLFFLGIFPGRAAQG